MPFQPFWPSSDHRILEIFVDVYGHFDRIEKLKKKLTKSH